MPNRRPTEWNEEIAQAILDRIEAGDSLKTILDAEGMPSRRTVRRWRAGENGAPESFGREFVVARELYVERLADEIIEHSDAALDASDHHEVHARKLQVDSRKWIASRLLRELYGDRQELKHTGDPKTPVSVHNAAQFREPTPAERRKVTAFVQDLFCGGDEAGNEDRVPELAEGEDDENPTR